MGEFNGKNKGNDIGLEYEVLFSFKQQAGKVLIQSPQRHRGVWLATRLSILASPFSKPLLFRFTIFPAKLHRFLTRVVNIWGKDKFTSHSSGNFSGFVDFSWLNVDFSMVESHGSLNIPIEHHPTIRYMVYNGYYFGWCPIFPKWDSFIRIHSHQPWDTARWDLNPKHRITNREVELSAVRLSWRFVAASIVAKRNGFLSLENMLC